MEKILRVIPNSFERINRHPVKLTALLYLKEALLNEVFEECPLFIQIAYEFGAKDGEIESLLEDPRRSPRG